MVRLSHHLELGCAVQLGRVRKPFVNKLTCLSVVEPDVGHGIFGQLFHVLIIDNIIQVAIRDALMDLCDRKESVDPQRELGVLGEELKSLLEDLLEPTLSKDLLLGKGHEAFNCSDPDQVHRVLDVALQDWHNFVLELLL